MINPISSISISPLSSSVLEMDMNYVNVDRGTYFYETTSLLDYLPKYEFLADLQDVYIDATSINFLTKQISLSSIASLDEIAQVSYFTNNLDETKNKSVELRDIDYLNNQFLITSPLSATADITIIPLKNHLTVSGELLNDRDIRYYDKIYKEGDDLFLQFKSETATRLIQPDTTETIYCPENIESFPLSSLDIIENGAYIGTCPANSDNIFLDRYGYSHITDSGYTGPQESSELLCVWTSENGLQERWYDPLNISQGDAYITEKANDEFNSTVDLSSNVIVEAKNKFQISRLGELRNTQYVNSLSSNLLAHFTTWSPRFIDEVNDIEGFTVGTYENINVDRLVLDGSVHAHIPPANTLYDNANTSVGVWVNSNDWSKGIDSQLWGNFSDEEGYGLFYNTGATNELITLPSNDGTIYGFNFRGYKIFEKNIESLSASKFGFITTDYFGNRWIWDQNSQQIIKLASDDIVTETIALPLSANIKSMKIDLYNSLHVLNATNNTLSSFDNFGTVLTAQSIPAPLNNFDFTADNDIIFAYGDNMLVDKNDDVYTTVGRNIYKNGIVWYHIAKKIQTLKLDSNDNIYVFSGETNLTKIDPTGSKLWAINIGLDINISDSIEMSFVKENNGLEDYDVLWVIFNERKILIKIETETGYIARRIDLKNVVNLKQCGNFNLYVKGDFTGAEVKRKFQPATSQTPTFSVKLNLTCGANTKIIQMHSDASLYQRGWVHLAFTHKVTDNETSISFFANGVLHEKTTLEGIYKIDFGTKVTPFIVGGNSGKLGAKNVERSLNDSGYFKGEVSDIRIYNITLDDNDIKSLARYKYWNKWTPLLVPIPTSPRTYLEKIKKFHLNKYPGFKSNKFNLRISGLPDTISQESVVNFITSRIANIKPAHTVLNSIIFQPSTVAIPNVDSSTWILYDGVWDDDGLWDDNETWNDG